MSFRDPGPFGHTAGRPALSNRNSNLTPERIRSNVGVLRDICEHEQGETLGPLARWGQRGYAPVSPNLGL
jgi:hypothetical protein